MTALILSDDGWDASVAIAGGDARLLLRGLLAMSPCIIRKVLEGAGEDVDALCKGQPVAALADAALTLALARYGDGRPVQDLLDDGVAALSDRLWRNYRADMRRLRGPGGTMELLHMNRARYAPIFPRLK
jgi:hypothetical protein